jgi:hypothetical protein
MDSNPAKALLVGEQAKGFSFLQKRLENRGCHCLIASGSEAMRIIERQRFDVVLCVDMVRRIDTLAASLIGSPSSLYCSHLLDDGCLWLPVVRQGVKCSGAPAMRPSEFANVLDDIVRGAGSRGHDSVVVGVASDPH